MKLKILKVLEENLKKTDWSMFEGGDCINLENSSFGISLCDIGPYLKLVVTGIDNDYDDELKVYPDNAEYLYLKSLHDSAMRNVVAVPMFP